VFRVRRRVKADAVAQTAGEKSCKMRRWVGCGNRVCFVVFVGVRRDVRQGDARFGGMNGNARRWVHVVASCNMHAVCWGVLFRV
jgi:hypothetical protein